MKYLLDTHAAIWVFINKEKLSEKAISAIDDSTNTKYVSIASAWEMAIKIRIEKLFFKGGVDRFLYLIDESGFILLPIKRKHVKIIETLPLLHRDPFDRILIASAKSENMCLITDDEELHNYEVPWIW